jgi:hypothetical protein
MTATRKMFSVLKEERKKSEGKWKRARSGRHARKKRCSQLACHIVISEPLSAVLSSIFLPFVEHSHHRPEN